jgi:hypothetical protein
MEPNKNNTDDTELNLNDLTTPASSGQPGQTQTPAPNSVITPSSTPQGAPSPEVTPPTPETSPTPITSQSTPSVGVSSPNPALLDGSLEANPTTSGNGSIPPTSGQPAPFGSIDTPPSGKKGKLKLLIVALVVILVLAGAYAFAFYLPNRPANVYKASIENSGKAVDKLVSYAEEQDTSKYKSYAFDGDLKVGGSTSFDVGLNGDADKNNVNMQISADIAGEKPVINIRGTKAKGNAMPDVYLQVKGIKSLLDSYGASSLDNLDGQWIVVDHTLVNKLVAQQNKAAAQSGEEVYLNFLDKKTLPTIDQVNDAISKAQEVNKQYIFTTNPSKAVLTNEKFIGKETKNGRKEYHYKVGYDKVHLQAYVQALADAVNSSQLNDWAKKVNNGEDLIKSSDVKSAQDQIKSAKSGYNFDLWADAKTKLVSQLQFTDPSDSSSKITIAQNYTGGSVYPFQLDFSGKDSPSGKPMNVSIGLKMNTDTHKYTVSLTGQYPSQDEGGVSNLSANFSITPGNNPVKVTVPSGAKPVMDVLGQLGLGSSPPTSATPKLPQQSLISL